MKKTINLICLINIFIWLSFTRKTYGANGKLNKKLTFFQTDEIRHIRDVDDEIPASDSSVSDMNFCSEDSLMNLLADIAVISPESLIQMTLNDQHGSCKVIASQMGVLKTYFRRCGMNGNIFSATTISGGGNSLLNRDLYMSLVRGIFALNEKVCMDQAFIARTFYSQ